MSVKAKVLAAAATLTLLGGAGVAAGAGVANAATPSCGGSCVDVFSHQFGTFADPQFVMDSYKQGDQVGTPVILFRTSNADPAEDFTIDNEGLVSEFYDANLVTAAVALEFGCTAASFGTCSGPNQSNNWAYEFMYSPYGVQTGLCVGVAATAVAGEKVTLQPCGVSGKTIWIADTRVIPDIGVAFPLRQWAEPLVNGSDTNFSEPYALTYPASGYPTDEPRPDLYTSNLLGFSTGEVSSNQLWSNIMGPLS
jgi:hypothetical protein